MGNSLLTSIGAQALNASYAQLLTTSNNISNTNTPGYSRQQAVLVQTEAQFTGSGYFGRGVTVQTVQRATNIFLTQQAATTASVAEADKTRRDMVGELEKIFRSNAGGLGAAATEIFDAWSDLAASPADLSARQAVLAKLEAFTTLANSNADRLDAMQANVAQHVGNSLVEVNRMLTDVAGLNRRIMDARAGGQPPNDLLDQRDALIAKISLSIDVSTVAAPDGSVGVFAAGGQNLVLGNQASSLVQIPDRYDPLRVSVGLKVGNSIVPLDANSLAGGSIAGALRFQNDDLAVARNQFGQFVAALAGTLNRQQSFGIDLTGASGAPVLQTATPLALPASNNAMVGGVFVASVSLAISDPNVLQASEYLLANDTAHAGRYVLTRLSDGLVTDNLASGATVDGFTFTVGVPLAAGDRFLLQPVGNAAATLRPALNNPRGLAAGTPVTAAAAAANQGSAGIGSLAITAAPTLPYSALTLSFIDSAGNWRLTDASSAVVASGTLVAGQPLSYNGIALRIDGAPAAGDVFTIVPTTFAAASNGNALATDALSAVTLVDGSTVTDAYAHLLAVVGARSAGARETAETSISVATAARSAMTGASGVNLDEEAARLMQFQQSYQAAAKVLQTAQAVLDTVMQLGSRG